MPKKKATKKLAPCPLCRGKCERDAFSNTTIRCTLCEYKIDGSTDIHNTLSEATEAGYLVRWAQKHAPGLHTRAVGVLEAIQTFQPF